MNVGHVHAIRGMHKVQAQLPLVVGGSILVEQVHQGLGRLLQGTYSHSQIDRSSMGQWAACLQAHPMHIDTAICLLFSNVFINNFLLFI